MVKKKNLHLQRNKQQIHALTQSEVKSLFSSAVWHQRFFMVCSSGYGTPHEPPQDLSHQSAMREWASSQAVCHSFILALLGMVIGSQSTSNRWIGPQPGWWSGSAVYARVYRFMCGGVRLCVLTLYACCSRRTTAHLFHSISPLSLIWILSSLNHCQCCCAQFPASGLQSRTVFLWTSTLDLAIKLLSRLSET